MDFSLYTTVYEECKSIVLVKVPNIKISYFSKIIDEYDHFALHDTLLIILTHTIKRFFQIVPFTVDCTVIVGVIKKLYRYHFSSIVSPNVIMLLTLRITPVIINDHWMTSQFLQRVRKFLLGANSHAVNSAGVRAVLSSSEDRFYVTCTPRLNVFSVTYPKRKTKRWLRIAGHLIWSPLEKTVNPLPVKICLLWHEQFILLQRSLICVERCWEGGTVHPFVCI